MTEAHLPAIGSLWTPRDFPQQVYQLIRTTGRPAGVKAGELVAASVGVYLIGLSTGDAVSMSLAMLHQHYTERTLEDA